ncbi:hypothetical protein HLB44_15720 [Aquincola sp. S2]|uniref:Uncharacterized protein n=1 Tax=Pseudaquabacterium terrae TaxID=2732868 RepID=A0ABX2EIK4_9BURK|nr:hypothetical protein [Aquabacterium terrae]NRF68443.1 hypothetical protein [Aquabacterium terrae]
MSSVNRIGSLSPFIPVQPVTRVAPNQGKSGRDGRGNTAPQPQELAATGDLSRLPEHLRLQGASAAPQLSLPPSTRPALDPARAAAAPIPAPVLARQQPPAGKKQGSKKTKRRQAPPQPSYLKLARRGR